MNPAEERPPLLLLKWQLIGLAACTPKLSAADTSVLWQLCERFNEAEGAAWPSLSLLAKDTSRDQKTVQRSLKRLISCGLVEVTQAGTRTMSNRYRPAFECVGASTPLQVGAPTPVGVGAPVSEGTGADVLKVGAPAPLESSYESGQETGFRRGGPAPAEAGAGGKAGTPPSAAPGQPKSERKFPEFWAAYPKATEVWNTECAIQEMLASGVPLSHLVDGAKRYTAWIKVQPWADKATKYTKGPLNWVKGRAWLDDYTITPKAPAPRPAPVDGAKPLPRRPDTSAAKAGTPAPRGLATVMQLFKPPSGPLEIRQYAAGKLYSRIVSNPNVHRGEKDRCIERIRREFPALAAAVAGDRKVPWPEVQIDEVAAVLSALKDEWQQISSRWKNNRERFAARRGAA